MAQTSTVDPYSLSDETFGAKVSAVLRRFAPSADVLLLRADGSRELWRGAARVGPGDTVSASFTAVELPEDLLLQRSLALPRLAPSDLENAIRIEAQANSPFPASDLVWNWINAVDPGGKRHARIVMASRPLIEQFVAKRWPESSGEAPPLEIWAFATEDRPVVLPGFGEAARLETQGRQRGLLMALAALAASLLVVVAVTPTLQLRARALEATAAHRALQTRVAPELRKRDELSSIDERLRQVGALVTSDRVDPAGALAYLTQALPDGTYLYGLDVQKTKITASGHTDDAAALLRKFSADPRLKEVRSPNAVTRLPGATKEAFSVEFLLPPTPVVVASPPPALPPTAAARSDAAAPATGSPFVVGGTGVAR